MNENSYRKNRTEFYEKILEFDFTIEDISKFLQDWEEIIRFHPDETYSPYLELNDLTFLYSVTKGDGELAVAYLNTLCAVRESISDESWNKFKTGQYDID